VNQFGQWFDDALHAGAFKTMPNNLTRPTASSTSTARPNTSTPNSTTCCTGTASTSPSPTSTPLLVVAWRLVQHDCLPIVVTRHNRGDYIDALEAADDGDLRTLVEFTARLRRQSILQAMAT